jgi:hypothetical protein
MTRGFVNYVALFVALSGTAYAAVIAPKNSVVTKSIKNGAVSAPKLHKGAVTTPKFAAAAVVPAALTADDAELLGGSAADAFQLRVTAEGCANERAIDSFLSNGVFGCRSPVASMVNQNFGQETIVVGDFLSTRLELEVTCHLSGQTKLTFHNQGDLTTLNWLYSDGTSVSASGVAVPQLERYAFDFAGKRLEGQFIWANPNGVTTLKLHVLDLGTAGCEVWGTAAFGPAEA